VVILELKVVQSPDERYPFCEPVEVAIVKVQAPDDEEMVMPVSPLVANDPAKYMVRSAERSPPPARPVPVFTALDDETAVRPREIVTAPVDPETNIGAVPAVEETKALPRFACFPLKVVQSVPERKPLTPEAEVAMDQVHEFPEEEAIEMPDSPEVAKLEAR
jgi:hypothetical protein